MAVQQHRSFLTTAVSSTATLFAQFHDGVLTKTYAIRQVDKGILDGAGQGP